VNLMALLKRFQMICWQALCIAGYQGKSRLILRFKLNFLGIRLRSDCVQGGIYRKSDIDGGNRETQFI
jgi:hypothetical protein